MKEPLEMVTFNWQGFLVWCQNCHHNTYHTVLFFRPDLLHFVCTQPNNWVCTGNYLGSWATAYQCLSCCALHNWLLNINGLDEVLMGEWHSRAWRPYVSNWLGDLDKHDFGRSHRRSQMLTSACLETWMPETTILWILARETMTRERTVLRLLIRTTYTLKTKKTRHMMKGGWRVANWKETLVCGLQTS